MNMPPDLKKALSHNQEEKMQMVATINFLQTAANFLMAIIFVLLLLYIFGGFAGVSKVVITAIMGVSSIVLVFVYFLRATKLHRFLEEVEKSRNKTDDS